MNDTDKWLPPARSIYESCIYKKFQWVKVWRGKRAMPQNVDLKIVVNKQKPNANREQV